jgi:hypothetical protein
MPEDGGARRLCGSGVVLKEAEFHHQQWGAKLTVLDSGCEADAR